MDWQQKAVCGALLTILGIGVTIFAEHPEMGPWAILGGLALVVWGLFDHADEKHRANMAAKYERETGRPFPRDAAIGTPPADRVHEFTGFRE